jgi:glycine cleavage system H protein
MTQIPTDLRYTENHEWVRTVADGILEVGITDHAQQALGDLISIALPEVGRNLEQGEACAVIESAKTTSEVYAPVAGAVTAANSKLANEPEAVNADAYGNWLMRIRPAAGTVTAPKLLSPDQYSKFVEADGG